MKKFLRAKKPEKIFMHWPRKIFTREMPTKKFLRRENSLLHPPPPPLKCNKGLHSYHVNKIEETK